MKKFTQSDFDNFIIDEHGFKICRSGDYTAIKNFGERCSFGEGCSFGKYCNFENGGVINGIYFACDRIGSEKRKTYFFKGDNGYFVRAGCFFGTFDDFIERVHQVHAITKYEKEYELAIELAKVVLG